MKGGTFDAAAYLRNMGKWIVYVLQVARSESINLYNYMNAHQYWKVLFNHVLLFVIYVLCFVYIQRSNTEFVGVIVFLVAHIMLLWFLLSVGKIDLNSWESITLVSVFMSGWTLLFVALCFLTDVYRRIYTAFLGQGKQPTLGSLANIRLKDHLISISIATTVMLWVFYLLYIFERQILSAVRDENRKNLLFSAVSLLGFFLVGTSVTSVVDAYILESQTKQINP